MKLFTGFLLLAYTAHAGVVYSFSGSYGYFSDMNRLIPASFTLSVPDVISADATYIAGPDLTCNGCSKIQIILGAHAQGMTPFPSSAFLFWPDLNGYYNFYFDPGAFQSLGAHQSIIVPINSGILIVAQTPEPSAFAPLLALLAIPYFAARRSSRR